MLAGETLQKSQKLLELLFLHLENENNGATHPIGCYEY